MISHEIQTTVSVGAASLVVISQLSSAPSSTHKQIVYFIFHEQQQLSVHHPTRLSVL